MTTDNPVLAEIKQSFAFLEKAVASFDQRFVLRVLRGLPALRKKLTPELLAQIAVMTYPAGDERRSGFVALAGANPNSDEMEVDGSSGATDSATTEPLPEIDMYVSLLFQAWLLHENRIDDLRKLSEHVVARLRTYNRRSLDYLASKIWFYLCRGEELSGNLEAVRPILLASLRTAALRHDPETEASLITLLLRNYLLCAHVTQASNLVSKVNFPENAANALAARYMYYLSKIRAIELDYTAAHAHITGAIRKAPQTPLAAGFLQAAQKLNIVIELLMGDIPERSVFKSGREQSLKAYFEVVKAVRVGDLNQFADTIKKYASVFKADGTYSLVLRLRQNVIKTGIRIMSLAYSRISLKDICIRLRLESEESAEYIVAKAIRDGVIEATIDSERGFMQSKEVLDVYSTNEPQQTFHDRIAFCIGLHNDSVKAMRYPMNSNRIDLKNADEARERERELVKEIEEGELDDDDDEDFDL